MLRSTFLTIEPKVAEFEKKFVAYLNIPKAIGLTSCTGVFHLTLLRHEIGISDSDEVITSLL